MRLTILLLFISVLAIGQPGTPDANGTITPGPPWVTGTSTGQGELGLQFGYIDDKVNINTIQLADSLGWFIGTSYGMTDGGSNNDAVGFRAAVDAAEKAGGAWGDEAIVYIPSGVWNLNDSIVLKSRVEIKVAREANFIIPSGYTGSVYYSGTDIDLSNAIVDGGFYQEASPRSLNWSGIKMYKEAADYAVFCEFKNMEYRYADAVIDVDLTGGAGAWANDNTFKDIIAYRSRSAIRVRADRGSNQLFDANKFINIKVQAGDSTMFGVDSLSGYKNTFDNITFWDFDVGEHGNRPIHLDTYAYWNVFNNCMEEPSRDTLIDNGINNNFIAYNGTYTELRGGLILDEDLGTRKDSIHKLIIANTGDAGTSASPDGDAGIKFVTYTSGATDRPPYYGTNSTSWIGGQNMANSNHGSTLVFKTHQAASDDSNAGYIDALILNQEGDATFVDDVTISDDLTVTGTQTFGNSATIANTETDTLDIEETVVKIDGDLYITGQTLNSCSGGLAYVSTPGTMTINTGGTFEKLDEGNIAYTADHLNNFTHSDGRLTYTGTNTLCFTLIVSVTVKSGETSQKVEFRLAKNGTTVEGTNMSHSFTATTIDTVIPLNWLTQLSTNDYVEVYGTSDTNADEFDIISLTATVAKH